MKPQIFNITPSFYLEELCHRYENLILLCPHCGYENTHHTGIEIFQRYEDSDTGIHVDIERLSMGIDTDADTHNPSRRRSGVRIKCYCEGCYGLFGLLVCQEEGRTYIGMEDLGTREEGGDTILDWW